jgi:hypothetical protein
MSKQLNSLWTFLDILQSMPINVKPQRDAQQSGQSDNAPERRPPARRQNCVFVLNSTADANGYVTLTDPLSGNPPIWFYRAALP